MKTYILRAAKTVEPQKSTPPPRPKPVATKGPALFIGLDVHNDSIAVSLAPSDGAEVRRYGIIGGEHDDVIKLAKKLALAHPDLHLKFCYEAGPRGFALCRCLRGHGLDCILVCPSKIPRKPGERVKTDRRDADDLARLYRAGELTGIYVPEPEDEAMRDLLRARFQVGRQQHRARQQLKMYLLRHNLRYGGKSSWTPAHLRYLAKLKMPFPVQQIVFQEMLEVLQRGPPANVRSDNGPEFVAAALKEWAGRAGIVMNHIEPGSPWENGHVESFHGKFRDGCLNREVFGNLLEAKVMVEEWRRQYNEERPHSSLGYQTPREYGRQFNAKLRVATRPSALR